MSKVEAPTVEHCQHCAFDYVQDHHAPGALAVHRNVLQQWVRLQHVDRLQLVRQFGADLVKDLQGVRTQHNNVAFTSAVFGLSVAFTESRDDIVLLTGPIHSIT